MSVINWKIGLYNRTATAQNSTSFDGTVTNEYLKHTQNVVWNMPLNGIDSVRFDLLLDDPAAALIAKKSSIIRIWRDINDTFNSKTKTTPAGTPDYCGVVTAITKSGSENKMTVTTMSPFWYLQSRFHILNHRLVTDSTTYGDTSDYQGGNTDNLNWDQSALMWRVIDLINGAFNDSGGDTGIRRPPTRDYSGTPGSFVGTGAGDHYWPKTANVAPFFISKGSNPWAHIFEDLMDRPSAPDIVPVYIMPTPPSRNTMYFYTDINRGTDRFSTVSMDYRTGNKNLHDLTEESQVVPGGYGNFVWVIGDGGPNGGRYGEQSDAADMNNKGLYMVRKEIKGKLKGDVDALAQVHLDLAMQNDDEVYTATLAEPVPSSTFNPLYFGIDYFLGDMIKLNGSRGALNVVNKKQRIYEVELTWSEQKTETAKVSLSNDFKGKFP